LPFDFSQVKDPVFTEVIRKTPHLKRYIENYSTLGNPLPIFTESLKPEHKKLKEPNILDPYHQTWQQTSYLQDP